MEERSRHMEQHQGVERERQVDMRIPEERMQAPTGNSRTRSGHIPLTGKPRLQLEVGDEQVGERAESARGALLT
jgi:hypothetical protein